MSEYDQAQSDAERVAVEAFLKGYRAGSQPQPGEAAPKDNDPYDGAQVDCQVVFEIRADIELSDEAVDKVRYKSALMAAAKIANELGISYSEFMTDADEAFEMFEEDE